MASHAPEQQSPLVESPKSRDGSEQNGLHLLERPFLHHLNVRADSSNKAVTSMLADSLGVALPKQPNQCHHAGSISVFWLSPDEWLVISSDQSPSLTYQSVIERTPALADEHFSLTDVSSGQTIIRLSGPNAAAALARGCPLDVHPSALPAGYSAQTHIVNINVLIWPVVDDAQLGNVASTAVFASHATFDLSVRRSFADYLWRWLLQVQSRLPRPD